jgi:hypothetical protein
MNDLDTRIRDTLARVAQTASATSRLDELTARRPRRVPALALAAVAVAAIAITPILLLGGESPRAPSGVGTGPIDIDPSWLVAEQEDVDAILAATAESLPEGLQGPGSSTRPPLASETAWCVVGLPERPWQAVMLPIALDVAVTEGALVEACAMRAAEVAADTDPPTEYTVCRAAYMDRTPLRALDDMTLPELVVVRGDTSSPGPSFPLVVARAADCSTEPFADLLPGMIVSQGVDYDQMSQGKDLEIAVLGASLRNCLSVDEARALAGAAHEELGPEWLLVDAPSFVTSMEDRFGGPVDESTGREDCHGPRFEFTLGFVAQPSLIPWVPSEQSTVSTLSPDQVEG